MVRLTSLTHLCTHAGHALGRHIATQHRSPQVGVLHVFQVGDPAPHAVLVFHVRVLELLEDACRWGRGGLCQGIYAGYGFPSREVV